MPGTPGISLIQTQSYQMREIKVKGQDKLEKDFYDKIMCVKQDEETVFKWGKGWEIKEKKGENFYLSS